MRFLIAFMLVLLAGSAFATPLPQRGTFIFSNACETEGGDFGNFRVTLVRGANDVSATIEFNDEGPNGQDVTHDVQFDSASGDLRFSYRDQSNDLHRFVGKVRKEKLSGTFDGAASTLPAIKKIPKYLPECR